MKLINPKAIILLLATLTFCLAKKAVIYAPYGHAEAACLSLTNNDSTKSTDTLGVYVCEGQKITKFYPCKSYGKNDMSYNIIQVLKDGEPFIGATSPSDVIILSEATKNLQDDKKLKHFVLLCAQNLEDTIQSMTLFTKKLK
jgi:hypothetical protein